jgi:hypothetical protein
MTAVDSNAFVVITGAGCPPHSVVRPEPADFSYRAQSDLTP